MKTDKSAVRSHLCGSIPCFSQWMQHRGVGYICREGYMLESTEQFNAEVALNELVNGLCG